MSERTAEDKRKDGFIFTLCMQIVKKKTRKNCNNVLESSYSSTTLCSVSQIIMYGINVIETVADTHTQTHTHVHIDISSFTLHDENNNIISLIKLHN